VAAAVAAMLPGSIVARASGDRVTALAASKRVKKHNGPKNLRPI